MKHGLKIPKLTCRRCRHQWTPRQLEVSICPKCKSKYWHVARTNRQGMRPNVKADRKRAPSGA